MATIPTYQQQVGIDAPGVPTPKVEDIGPGASPVGAIEATEKIGAAAENIGTQLGRHMAYMARLQQQQDTYDRASEYARQGKLFLEGDGKDQPGLLHLKGAEAKDALNKFQDWDAEQKKQMLKGVPAYERKNLTRAIDAHGTVFFDNVLKHQQKETYVAQQNSLAAHAQSLEDTASLPNTTPEQFKALITQAQDITKQMKPGEDERTYEAMAHKTASSFMQNFLKANIEDDPQKVDDMLKATKDMMHPADAGVLQKQIDGKMLDIRRNAVWEQVSEFKHEDGTIDLSKAEAHARHLASTLPPGQQQHVVDFVKQQANVADAALKDQREATTRQFFNDALKLKGNGVPYQDAHDLLFKQKGYGFDDKDREDKTKQLIDLYSKRHEFDKNALEHQTPEQKLMWNQIDQMAKAKYGNHTAVLPGDEENGAKTRLHDAFMTEMKHQVMGKSPQQMLAVATERLKEVVTKPGFLWDTKKPAWEIDRDVRNLNLQKMAALETKYGSMIPEAAAYLKKQGLTNPTADDIKKLIDRMPK